MWIETGAAKPLPWSAGRGTRELRAKDDHQSLLVLLSEDVVSNELLVIAHDMQNHVIAIVVERHPPDELAVISHELAALLLGD